MRSVSPSSISETLSIAYQFLEIIFTLKDKVKDFEIIDSVCKDFKPDTNPLIFLAKAIEFLSQADVVVMGRGWNEARGCKVEELCAREYGKEIIYM